MSKRVIVAGPPCSGKSNYVRAHMQAGELVYDYDTLHQALSGRPIHHHAESVRPYVLSARDAVMDQLGKGSDSAWVITATPKSARLKDLEKRLGAKAILLSIDREEAHRRCDVAGRPEEWHGFIDRWYDSTDIDPADWPRPDGKTGGRNMKYKAFKVTSFKAVQDAPDGTFEAIVAVFNNVDRIGDRILPGAFANTLQDWGQKGRPIPVVFAHQWDNLDAHIGQVLEAKEVMEGLYVKGQLEMDEPFAQRVWKKMNKGTLAEFSFAYDVVQADFIDNGKGVDPRYINDLKQLDLFEVGPCLVGMNPDTELLGVKEGRRHSTGDQEAIQAAHDLLAKVGAKCGQGEGTPEDETGDGKSSRKPSTLAARVAADLLELGIDL